MITPLRFAAFIFCLNITTAQAEATLSSVMAGMKSTTATRISYQETRTLELMDEPWEGSGYMYSLPPDTMVKEQLLPKRVVMGIKGDQLFYFDQENDIHYQGELKEDDPMSLNIAIFKALVNADEVLLNKLYKIDFSHQSVGWKMILTPKKATASGFSTQVAGKSINQIDTIKIQQADGDSSDFILKKDASGERVKNIATRLYQELRGE